MKLLLNDTSFAELQLIEEWAAEHPKAVKLKKVMKDDGIHYHYALQVADKRLLFDLHERIEKLRHNQRILSNFYDLKSRPR